jgi:hypothetical protein
VRARHPRAFPGIISVAERRLIHIQLAGNMRNRAGVSTTILAASSLNSGETSSDFWPLDPVPFQVGHLKDAAVYRGIGPGYYTEEAVDPVVFVMPLKVF